jgi:hypothetical protein
MKNNELTHQQWEQAEILANTLSEYDVPGNLIKQAITYLRNHPMRKEIPTYKLLLDYLVRMSKIGPLFLSGNESEQQRKIFGQAIRKLIPENTENDKLLLILGWSARLMTSQKPAVASHKGGRQ